VRRSAFAAAWAAGSIVSATFAWSAVAHVAPPRSDRGVQVLTANEVSEELALTATTTTAAPPPTSSTTSLIGPPTTVAGGGAGATTAAPAPTVPAGAMPSTTRPPAATTTPPPGLPIATTAAPTTTAGPGPAPTMAPTTTTPPSGNQPLVIVTTGGTIAVRCASDSTLSVAWASPKPDYAYAATEVGRTHIHARFTSSHHVSSVEVECEGTHPHVEVEEDD
jgi:hypothetical protein